MFAPLRIDHHGWQLALLGLAVSGMADPRRARGGAVLGIASGLSLSIGLEMMIYLDAAGRCDGAAVGRRPRPTAAAGRLCRCAGVDDRGRLPHFRFGGQPSGGVRCIVAGLAERCGGRRSADARPGAPQARWLEGPAGRGRRGRGPGSRHSTRWPGPTASAGWKAFLRKRPRYGSIMSGRRGHSTAMAGELATVALALPVTALLGWAMLVWRAWKMGSEGRDLLQRTLAVALPAIAALALLFWQMRAAPAAQMMALAGRRRPDRAGGRAVARVVQAVAACRGCSAGAPRVRRRGAGGRATRPGERQVGTGGPGVAGQPAMPQPGRAGADPAPAQGHDLHLHRSWAPPHRRHPS